MRSPPPSSKSRSTNGHDKPKRPLSGYNLFYRYKRHAIVTQVQSTGSCEKLGREEVLRILSTPSGLETQAIAGAPSSDHLRSLREVNIRSMMDDKLFPNENRNRSHRKVHGIGFLELNRLMRQEWAKLDNFTRKIFQDLAEIGCARYRKHIAKRAKCEAAKMQQKRPPPAGVPLGAPNAMPKTAIYRQKIQMPGECHYDSTPKEGREPFTSSPICESKQPQSALSSLTKSLNKIDPIPVSPTTCSHIPYLRCNQCVSEHTCKSNGSIYICQTWHTFGEASTYPTADDYMELCHWLKDDPKLTFKD